MSSASVHSLRNTSSAENRVASPVALFVYNRADNTRQTLRALMANTLAPQTDLYVFSDGGRDEVSWAAVNEVRALLHETEAEVARAHTLKSMTIVERPVNFYLERNIIEGISEVFRQHETVIVLEDDIVTAPHYLEFMNDAFEMYRDEKQVMHVSGFTRLDTSTNPHPSYFTPFMAGWGWGTWRDRWNGHFHHYASRDEALDGLTSEQLEAIEYGGVFPCLKDLNRQPIPWDICWSIAIRRAGGLCLYPSQTLVRNIGLDAGTHYRALDLHFSFFNHQFSLPLSRLLQHYDYDRPPYEGVIKLTAQQPAVSQHIEAALKKELTDWGIRYTWLGKVVRYIYKKIIKPGT